jgi:hypothetical protein
LWIERGGQAACLRSPIQLCQVVVAQLTVMQVTGAMNMPAAKQKFLIGLSEWIGPRKMGGI